MTTVTTFEELKTLAAQSEALSLGDGSPGKRQEFYLFRGATQCHELMSSIQVHLSERNKTAWRAQIRNYERELVNRFLDEVEPCRELNDQYHWYCPPCPRTDSFWYLSVMQHFGCPTRFCDFTADFWMAAFFAADGARDQDACIYRLKCRNEDENDMHGNKLPKDSEGCPWPSKDMNEMLGFLIGYKGFDQPDDAVKQNLQRFLSSADGGQMYGWDVPHFKNGRIRKQSGYFVYPVDVTIPLEESLARDGGTEYRKYQISAKLLPEIRQELSKRGLVRWKVYLDLDRTFKQWKDEELPTNQMQRIRR